ncbi:hypothetical protein QTP86_024831, partial [Hemibagrus guttatus]
MAVVVNPGLDRSVWIISELGCRVSVRAWRKFLSLMLCKRCSVGPDGIGNYRDRLCDFPYSIGALSSEATGDLNYLFRPALHAPAWLPKHCYVGGVGWGIQHGLRLNARSLLSNTQIKRSDFRTAMEDRISQIFQTSWQVPPCFLDRQEPGTRGDQSAYKNDSQNGNNQIRLRK